MSTAPYFKARSTTGEMMKPKHSGSTKVEPTAAIETITPAIAHALLAHNTHNRGVSARVKDLARAISEGYWVVNGETIKVATDETLIDGQHRLLAVIEAKTPIQTWVVRGLPKVAQETVDIGRKRTVGDALNLRGEPNYNILGAALAFVWRLEHSGHTRSGGDSNLQPQQGELLDYLEGHRGLTRSIPLGVRIAKELRFPGGVAAGLHYLMAKKRPTEADEFWVGVETGQGLPPGSPIAAFRQFLIRDLGSSRRSNVQTRTAIAIKAWNAYLHGTPAKMLVWKSTEDFPKIEG